MNLKNQILPLKGKVQHYAWGGYDYIPQLVGLENKERKPCAEYWMGAHPGAPSEVTTNGSSISLNQLIEKNPSACLGEKVLNEFGELPYLFKVLDVKDMLSIQVHPTKEEAIKGYDAEETAGIPINAADRNYKDKNHKPEVMVALSEFWLLHGFKTKESLRNVLLEVPEFTFLVADFDDGNYFELYKTVMELPQKKVDEILLPLVQRELNEQGHLPEDAGYWVQKLFSNTQDLQNLDRGIFSIYFFNIVKINPREAIFQGAGIPHAYLRGQNVELMANSDNVLRGGLTPKHIDVPELLKHTLFQGIKPQILKGELLETGEINYPCPVNDFSLSALRLNRDKIYTSSTFSSEIFLVIEGGVEPAGLLEHFQKGDTFIILPETEYTLRATSDTLIYKAFVPRNNL